MSSRPADQPETTLARIMEERRTKARALRAAGSDPFRNDIGPAISLGEVRARYEATRPAPAEPGTAAAKGDGITPIDGQILRVDLATGRSRIGIPAPPRAPAQP